ncbi:3-hydroxyacyl-CoA dehydrogenase NAD-binding domain-containing protein [Rhodovulum sp. ES.010]|uniref:3-hydroxyacyl-CoA dehydrogenase NAD-binding domain-containing protein n=1 Tax=Rhodovulum sp. ES.010 TaxID=1882821 RepID=UPI000940CFC8|nr:3-hydroxyacyl-CoA dehydrogenase NAD-binding domain-containing protein [Rhodovulum sp. ES.010]
MNVQTVGVVGAGQMGNGISHVFAPSGFDVILSDISEDALARARKDRGKHGAAGRKRADHRGQPR